jgi:hypothetical protein
MKEETVEGFDEVEHVARTRFSDFACEMARSRPRRYAPGAQKAPTPAADFKLSNPHVEDNEAGERCNEESRAHRRQSSPRQKRGGEATQLTASEIRKLKLSHVSNLLQSVGYSMYLYEVASFCTYEDSVVAKAKRIRRRLHLPLLQISIGWSSSSAERETSEDFDFDDDDGATRWAETSRKCR